MQSFAFARASLEERPLAFNPASRPLQYAHLATQRAPHYALIKSQGPPFLSVRLAVELCPYSGVLARGAVGLVLLILPQSTFDVDLPCPQLRL